MELPENTKMSIEFLKEIGYSLVDGVQKLGEYALVCRVIGNYDMPHKIKDGTAVEAWENSNLTCHGQKYIFLYREFDKET